MNRVVAVAPHPDDDAIGCGGSLAKHADSGADVSSVTVIGRERSIHDRHMTDEEFRAETAEACRVLGVARWRWLDEPSRDVRPNRALYLRLVAVLRELVPDVLYLPHHGDGDVEHRLVHELTIEAVWMAASPFFPEAGEPIPVPSLMRTYEVWGPMPQFAVVEDISTTVDRKVAALRCYRSQLKHANWDAAVEGLAAYRGATGQGHGHAEVFGIEYAAQQIGKDET